MSEIQIVKVDQGGVNARILAKEAKADFRRVEAASLKMPTRFTSAEGKRFFARLFNTLQLNTHFISVIARTRLDHEDVAKVEEAIRAQMDTVTENLNKAIDGAEALFKVHGITSTATYDTVPLDVDVHVLSSIGRRFLEVLGKLDQLMPLLQTLEIHEVITTQAVDMQRASSQTAGARCRQWCAKLCDGVAAADECPGRARCRRPQRAKPARGRSRGCTGWRGRTPSGTRRGGRSDGGRRQHAIAGSLGKYRSCGWRLTSMAAPWRELHDLCIPVKTTGRSIRKPAGGSDCNPPGAMQRYRHN